MTYADLAVADLLETAMKYGRTVEWFQTNCPALHAVCAKTIEDERVKSYKEKRGPKKLSDESWKKYVEAKAPVTFCPTCSKLTTTPGSCSANDGTKDTETAGTTCK